MLDSWRPKTHVTRVTGAQGHQRSAWGSHVGHQDGDHLPDVHRGGENQGTELLDLRVDTPPAPELSAG